MNNFDAYCNNVNSPNGDNNLGCTYNVTNNNCEPIVAWEDCNVYNGFFVACEADTTNCGVYKYDDDTCSSTTAPSYTNGSNCSTMNGYKTECDSIAAGSGKGEYNRGCSFNWIDGTCVSTPDYTSGTTNCNIFNGL